VRKALGDSGREQKFVRTFARKGIRFIGEVIESHAVYRSENVTKQQLPRYFFVYAAVHAVHYLAGPSVLLFLSQRGATCHIVYRPY
jgi:DNA-binding winged helix-turn-helix (wHTH) protein